jgi:hypothetical protein
MEKTDPACYLQPSPVNNFFALEKTCKGMNSPLFRQPCPCWERGRMR